MASKLKELYLSEVKSELTKLAATRLQFITPHDTLLLPEPVKRYFRYCGYIGKYKMLYASVIWEKAFLKTSLKGNWKKIECTQFNAVEEPVRIVYMKSKLFRLFSFEGMDTYRNGHGNMKIRLCNFISVANAKGRETDASELVTILAEALLIPSCAWQRYIAWHSVNETTARAKLTYNGTRVSGTFYFTEDGKLTRFETDDRYYSKDGKSYRKMKWSVEYRGYKTKNGIGYPSFCKASWHTPTGELEYFKGWIKNIVFDSSESYVTDTQWLTMS